MMGETLAVIYCVGCAFFFVVSLVLEAVCPRDWPRPKDPITNALVGSALWPIMTLFWMVVIVLALTRMVTGEEDD